jgi:hypothetical protein
MPSVGAAAPDWLKRFEADVTINENDKPEWSILTVQPLFESEDLQDTIFTQLSQRRYYAFTEVRDVSNLGIGYRRLLFDNTVLVGVNGFFDYEWDNHHQRTSAGAEIKWAGLDFYANRYWGISSEHTIDVNGTVEEPVDGHDIELVAQVPYVPWARIHGRRYWWNVKGQFEDIKGWEVGGEFDLVQNLQIKTGVKSDNYMSEDNNQNEVYVMVRFRMDFGRPVALSNRVVDADPWIMRDMSEYRLDKVRRQNKIILQRTGSGVVVSRR